MTGTPSYTVFILPSVSHAMKGEKALTRAGIANKLIPTPRSLSSKCGVCLRVDPADRDRAREVLTAAGVEISAVHDFQPGQPSRSPNQGEHS